MKNLLFVLLFAFPFVTQADTLDFWSVRLNDSLLANFNSLSETLEELTLELENLNEQDTLVVHYRNDHPCYLCEHYYAVKNSEGEKLFVKILKGDNRFDEVKFPAKTLLKDNGFIEADGPKTFEFFLFIHGDGKSEGEYISLLKVVLLE